MFSASHILTLLPDQVCSHHSFPITCVGYLYVFMAPLTRYPKMSRRAPSTSPDTALLLGLSTEAALFTPLGPRWASFWAVLRGAMTPLGIEGVVCVSKGCSHWSPIRGNRQQHTEALRISSTSVSIGSYRQVQCMAVTGTSLQAPGHVTSVTGLILEFWSCSGRAE